MESIPLDVISSWVPPWHPSPPQFFSAVESQLPFDQIAVGIPALEHPQADELIQSQGFPAERLTAWFTGGSESDPLFQAALRSGMATAQPAASHDHDPLTHGTHAMMHVLAESSCPRRGWWLLLTRRDQPFTDLEQKLAGLMLRQWQMGFSQPDEPGMGRLMLGHDDRLLLTDINTQVRLLGEPLLHHDLLAALRPVVEQRYANLPDLATSDVVLPSSGASWWVSLRRGRALPGEENEYRYLELRRLDDNELPAVGLVADLRIAQALAYIHENYHLAPSLSDVARAVQISPFHFHRLFTALVGVSPKQYLQGKQLQMARWLLRRGGVPIGMIAQRTGFSSHGHFTSTFHRVVGVSPTAYREQHRA